MEENNRVGLVWMNYLGQVAWSMTQRGLRRPQGAAGGLQVVGEGSLITTPQVGPQ